MQFAGGNIDPAGHTGYGLRMTPKIKITLLLVLSVLVSGFAAYMLKQSTDEGNLVKVGWGLVFTIGCMTLVRGVRLFGRIK